MAISKAMAEIYDLYYLFFTKNLMELHPRTILDVKPMTPVKSITKIPIVTPMTQQILQTISPEKHQKFLGLIQKDNRQLEIDQKLNEIIDSDYIHKMENNGLGFFMENIVQLHFKCPVCQEYSLRKFAQSNIPAIDFVCVNKENHLTSVGPKCFTFQLKISLNDTYFSLKTRSISVGSKYYGQTINHIEGSDSLMDKLIVPGYICLRLRALDSQQYSIIQDKSFILIPDYENLFNEPYYQYIKPSYFGSNQITWNPKLVELNQKIPNLIIKYDVFEETLLDNPYKDLVELVG